MIPVDLTVNGEAVSRAVSPRMHLADFVREELNLTGTHIGCEHGVCGACTMMVDGRPVRSCISYAAACDGSDVRTVESFDDDPVMTALRAAFTRHHALQCGYCTPGMLTTAYDIVTRLPNVDEARIREELAGNLCRCTGYVGIVAAIRDVLASGPHASLLKAGRPGVPARSVPVRTTTQNGAVSHAQAVAHPALPPLTGGRSLTRTLDVAVPVDALWQTLKQVDVTARCLPGAMLQDVKQDGEVTGAIEVAIGPMRARFNGSGRVQFNDTGRHGEVSGGGSDAVSRSQASGSIAFSAEPAPGDGSRLVLELTYRLAGPLAQFGRPAVVDAVVDQLLAQFARNLAQACRGGTIVAQKPVGGLMLVLMALAAMVRGCWPLKRRSKS